MRIALLNPTYWPEVRRGAERMAHDLAAGLAARGHDVTLLTTHRAAPTTGLEDGFHVRRGRRMPSRLLDRRGFEYHLADVPGAMVRLLRGRYDVVHALFHADGWAAVQARRAGGPPVVLSPLGICNEASIARRRLRRPVFAQAIRGASAVTALSEAAARNIRRIFGVTAEVLPPGVFAEQFRLRLERAAMPTVVCSMALNDPRKRAALLFRGFERLRARRPTVRLLLAGSTDPQHRRLDAAAPAGVEWVDGGSSDALARAYAGSWLSVLPAVDEAFGLVLVESLAAGTPVVAARSGASPEIVTSSHVGRLFEADDEASLEAALDEGLELVTRSGVEEACRARASEYEWSRLLPAYESVYERVLATSR